MKINIIEIVELLESLPPQSEHDYYYDPYNHTVYEDCDENQYLLLPKKDGRKEYEMMRAFIDELDDEKLQHDLSDAIVQRGAFRQFRAVLQRHGMLNDWYAYKSQAYEQIVMDWCEELGLAYEYTEMEEDDDTFDEDAFLHHDFTRKEETSTTTKTIPLHIVEITKRNCAKMLYLINQNKDMDETELEAEIDQNDGTFAISDQGRFIGYYSVKNHILKDLYVMKDQRRKGAGTMLFQHCIEHYPDLHILIKPANKQAQSFLAKQGFDTIAYYEMKRGK